MPRFEGIPVEEEKVKKPRFGGVPVEQPEVEAPGFGDQLKRQLGRTGRIAAEAFGALPLIPIDAGINARNLITGSNYKTGSEMYGEALDATGLPRPEGMAEKGVDLAGQMLLTSKLPNPTIKNPAPSGFGASIAQFSDDMVKQNTIKESIEAGYKIPPVSAKPNAMNTLTESISGKAATAQTASVKNQKVTNDLVRKEFNLIKEQPLTHGMLKGIRDKAGQVYKKISKSGQITADDKYIEGLTGLSKSIDDLAKDFPEANLGANDEITKLVDSLLKDKFSAKGAMEYIKQLRKDASGNFSGMYDPKKQALGHAQRQAAEVIEDLVKRNLHNKGLDDLANSFEHSRKMIAKTYTVDAALNEATGNVIASKLAQQLSKGKPISGNLEKVAKFARAFPKAAEEIKHSPGVSAVDAMVALGLGTTIDPLLYAIPPARLATRAAILSKPFQRGLANTPAKAIQAKNLNLAVPSAIMANQGMPYALQAYKSKREQEGR